MKQETKELIKWAISLITDYRVQNMVEHSNFRKNTPAAQNSEIEIKNCEEFADFLNSLPEIEKKLCFGGYIQDRNGTPCCHGDKVMVMNKGLTAEDDDCSIFRLYWSVTDFRFYLNQNLDPKEKPAGLHLIPCNFEKVEE